MAKQHEHEFVATHHACPRCNSRDNAATRSNGSVWCFSCQDEVVGPSETESDREGAAFSWPSETQSRPQPQALSTQRPRGQVQRIPDRQLDDLAALKRYEYEVDADGNPIEPVPSNIDEEMAEDMAKLWKVFSDESGSA